MRGTTAEIPANRLVRSSNADSEIGRLAVTAIHLTEVAKQTFATQHSRTSRVSCLVTVTEFREVAQLPLSAFPSTMCDFNRRAFTSQCSPAAQWCMQCAQFSLEHGAISLWTIRRTQTGGTPESSAQALRHYGCVTARFRLRAGHFGGHGGREGRVHQTDLRVVHVGGAA